MLYLVNLKGYEVYHYELFICVCIYVLTLNVFIRIDAPHPKQLVAVMHQIGMPSANKLTEEEEL